ncbi:SidE phosphodiesterase domain-containing protein [Legionella bononiensis]|uniref:SidE PDE domain-containing protein n=1 Tax=Legionella bononiensis TaxID=2793102 RepID=A0ABS1WF72_9GAMM|nr:SidE phosphodiesterase domain-containing protein [Legionella bononiensis]MBL7479277.1 hypothetical protein [Legionella bononiensis]MBL7527995.1 hypothetical protein [Legionella bononiensis]MBL7563928.1 hypothetical protein [Legionella bononiensis]
MIKFSLSAVNDVFCKLIINDQFVKYIKKKDVPNLTSDLKQWLLDNKVSVPELDLTSNQTYELKFDSLSLENSFYHVLTVGISKKAVVLPTDLQCSPIDKKLPVLFSYGSLERFHRYWESPRDLGFSLYEQLSQDLIEIPYVDEPDEFLQFFDRVAFHQNHGTTHAIRQMELATNFLTCIQLNGNKKYRFIAQSFSAEENACLQLAAFLFRSGRTNELPWHGDGTYGPRSAAIFKQIALELEFNPVLVDLMANCFDYHAEIQVKNQLNQHSIEETREKAHLFTKLLKLSHESDLVRCFDNYQEIKRPIEEELSKLLDPSVKVSAVSDHFLAYAVTLCHLTGATVTGAKSKELNTTWNRRLAVESANSPKLVLFKLICVKPECNPSFMPPTQLWIEDEHHTEFDKKSGSFLLKAHDKKGQNIKYADGWDRKSIDMIPTDKCIDIEREYLNTHVSVYHSTTKASYALDLFCRKLIQLKGGSNSIVWIRGINSKPSATATACDSIDQIKKIMSQANALDNNEYNLWHLLSCNPSLWQNADYASDESSVDYFYNNLSVTQLDFKHLINTILDSMGLLKGQEALREELLAKFNKLITDERFGKQGVLYQYLIPHHLVDEIAYISKQNGIVDSDNPSALETLVQLKAFGGQVPNQYTLQVRLFVPKLLNAKIAEQLVVTNYLNMKDQLREEFEKTVNELSVMAFKGPTQALVEKAPETEPQHSYKFFDTFIKGDRDLSQYVVKKEVVPAEDEEECFLFSDSGSASFWTCSTN